VTAGYDIGGSLSGSSSAATNLNSAFNISGGGGSGATSGGNATGINKYWVIAGGLVLGAVIIFLLLRR
jgi:hypothetical protein